MVFTNPEKIHLIKILSLSYKFILGRIESDENGLCQNDIILPF